MCWNYEVSLAFSGLFLLINSYYYVKKPKYWEEYLLFGMFYFCMEAFQTLQWLYGNVYPANEKSGGDFVQSIGSPYGINLGQGSFQGIAICDITNYNFTIVAHLLIWLQPVLFSYIGCRTSDNKRFFNRFFYLTCAVLIFSLVLLLAGYDHRDYYTIENSIFGLSTCTNKGVTGHLVWRFKPASIDYFPNYLTYLVLCITSFVMYDKKEIQIIGVGWLVSLVLTKFILNPTLLEVASSWCLLSIIGNCIIFCNIRFG
jgi:hypothetical protein